jgi:2-oxoglutarate dehydrogenase E2 component (dihydrolipoamide succinyltransferase)
MSEPFVVLVPQINPNDENAVVVRWHVQSGERVTAGQPLVTLETTKATFDVDAPQEGFAFYVQEPNTLVAVGAPVAWIAQDESPPPTLASVAHQAGAPRDAALKSRFTRKAWKAMKEHGLTAADFPGDRRVDVASVERVLTASAEGRPGAARSAADSRGGNVKPLEQSPSKIIEVQMLTAVYRAAVPSTVSIALSSEKSEARLRQLAGDVGPVSLLELAIFEAAQLLPDWPELNGFYADGCAWRYESVAVGFALNLGRALRVPVVKTTAQRSLTDVMRAIRDLSLRYMRDELTIDDLTGGTCTITDLSAHGVVHFIPVLNHAQSAILGICAERPAAGSRDLVLTFDHRLSDGMRAANFLAALRERLESVGD